jgi:hypothetical protein
LVLEYDHRSPGAFVGGCDSPIRDELVRRDGLELQLFPRFGARQQDVVVVAEAAGVVEQHPYGDLLPEGARDQAGQVTGDRRVESDPVFADQLQHRRSDEGLGDTADPLTEPRSHRPAGVKVGDTGGQIPRAASVTYLGEHTRHPGRMLGVQ